MAYFSRLIFVALFFIHGSVFAVQVKVSPVYYYAAGSYGHAGLTPQAACTSYANALSYTFISVVGNTCNYSASNGTWFPTASVYPGCPGGVGSVIGDGCYVSASECPEGTQEDSAGFCKDLPPECQPNQELDPETNTCVCKDTNGKPAGSFAVNGDTYVGCNDGCKIVLTSGSYSSSTNKTYGIWQQTGDSCSPSPGSPGVDAPDSDSGKDAGKCPTGQCPGTFNGQSMCVPCKGKESSDSSSSENTTETPNGASAPSGSSSGSSSGSKSTECDGGVCVTKEKVVVVNPDGSTTEKEKETTESISDFCAKNPKSGICKSVEEGKWGGSCSGGFQCSGDPVQCAQAQASWKSACAGDVSGMTEQINTGSAAMAAGASSGLGIPGGSDAFDLGSRLSEVPLFGSSGGCPSDVSVNVGGTSYTIAFSAMCGQLQVLGVALMGFAYLIAGFIVFRGDRS